MDNSAHSHVVPPGLFTGGGKPPRLSTGEHRELAKVGREIRLPCNQIREDLLISLLRAGMICRLANGQVEITARGISTLLQLDPIGPLAQRGGGP